MPRVSARTHQAIYASAYKNRQHQYGIAWLDATGKLLQQHRLPERGHGIACHPASGQLVLFARRPGTTAWIFNQQQQLIGQLQTPLHTHFCGHGVFSYDGKRIFTTENDFDQGRGLIGIYDTTRNFRRLGDYTTHGIGPHEVIRLPDSDILCVANGGILTHPESGRAKLNLADMQSSVVFIDGKQGQLLSQFNVPYQRLSLRHAAAGQNQTIWLGGQYEGDSRKQVPLIACAHLTQGLSFPTLPESALTSLANYIGSVACSQDGKRIAFSSPRGHALLMLNAHGQVMTQHKMESVCGLAAGTQHIISSSLTGRFQQSQHTVFWDNHLSHV